MKKMNVLMTAAVAGLFAVSAQAGDKAAPKTEKGCKDAKMTWKDSKCSCKAADAPAPTPVPAAK